MKSQWLLNGRTGSSSELGVQFYSLSCGERVKKWAAGVLPQAWSCKSIQRKHRHDFAEEQQGLEHSFWWVPLLQHVATDVCAVWAVVFDGWHRCLHGTFRMISGHVKLLGPQSPVIAGTQDFPTMVRLLKKKYGEAKTFIPMTDPAGAGIYANMTGVYWWDPWSTIYLWDWCTMRMARLMHLLPSSTSFRKPRHPRQGPKTAPRPKTEKKADETKSFTPRFGWKNATSECHFHQLQRDISVEVFAADLDLGCSNCSI